MSATLLPADVVTRLNDLFTRVFIGAGTYVFESEMFVVEADAALLDALRDVRAADKRHALLLANLIRMHDRVPEPGVFPYWHRDLNYLTVPFMANFMAEALAEDLVRIDAAGDVVPAELRTIHATLRTIRKERAAQLATLRPMADEAAVRERAAYQAEIDAVRSQRQAREAQAAAEAAAVKAAAAAARKAAAAAKAAAPGAFDPSSMPDPSEEGISAKEKAKRTMMIKRAQKKAADAAAAAPAAAPAFDPSSMPDPSEEGISAKERAKRTMMIKRAQKAAEAAAPAAPAPPASPAFDASSMPDPDEPGISAKERAKRTMMIRRAQKKADG